MLKKPIELFRGLQTVLRNEMVKEKVDMKRKKHSKRQDLPEKRFQQNFV